MAEKFSNAPASTVAHGWGSYDLMLATLRDGLAAGPWVLGARFSAADVLLGTACHFLRQFKLIESDPVLFAYVDRCMERPALGRALALDVL